MPPTEYNNTLAECRDLTREAPELAPILFRDDVVTAVARSIAAGRSVLLVGSPEVGKTSVVRALALRLAQAGPRKLYELATVQLLAGTVFVGEWQSKVTALFDAAAMSHAILYFSDIWNLRSTGRSSSTKDTVWDALRPRLSSGTLQVIGEVDDQQLLTLNAVPGFTSAFDVIEVPPLSAQQIAMIVRAAATHVDLPLQEAAAARLLELCGQFLPSAAGPGPALRLLDQIRHYLDEKRGIGEDEPVDAAFVEKVFSVYSGLPRFVVSRTEVLPVATVRDWFRARIIGQHEAIEAVVQMITLFKAGLHDSQRPVGSLLFVGPTGVGKTELARALATFLFGSEKRLLRFDLSEFKDYHSFQMLIGDPDKPDRPARLVDPVRAQPFQVVLLDEIEKAHFNVWDLLLQLLDAGQVTPANSPTVNFRNTIVIATTNVGAQALAKRSVGFAGNAVQDDSERFQSELEAVFRPELLNRFQHIVRFLRLSKDEVHRIAHAELRRAVDREGIVGRKLAVDVGNDVLDLVVAQGYDEKYGARALKRQLQRLVIMPIATLLMERTVAHTSILRLTVRHGAVSVAVLDSEQSRANRRESAPLRLASGQKVGREDLPPMLADAAQRLAEISSAVGLSQMRAKREELEARRREVDLWRDPRAAAVLLESCDRLDRTIERIERLESEGAQMSAALSGTSKREELRQLAERIQEHIGKLTQAHLEIVRLGDAGNVDALVEIRPIGRGRPARDLLHATYTDWAHGRKCRVTMIREPMLDDEPVVVSISGPYVYGYLRGEMGHHRLRTEDGTFVAKVTVAPLDKPSGRVRLSVRKALKQVGQYGGRVRSRVAVADSELVLQNAASVAENTELAEELGPSWLGVAPQGDESVVRRYDMDPFLVRDFRTDLSTGRAEILRPEPFHELLCQRITVAPVAE